MVDDELAMARRVVLAAQAAHSFLAVAVALPDLAPSAVSSAKKALNHVVGEMDALTSKEGAE